jgi:hypothetical protein
LHRIRLERDRESKQRRTAFKFMFDRQIGNRTLMEIGGRQTSSDTQTGQQVRGCQGDKVTADSSSRAERAKFKLNAKVNTCSTRNYERDEQKQTIPEASSY